MAYWSKDQMLVNGVLFLHLLGAMIVGLVLGYERTYHGRAAGIRTYTLVCLASTMLTAMNGYPALWYGGMSQSYAHSWAAADPTRVVQGVMTGIGFLCAGVIMKEGFTIRGLSTSASIWMTAGIGVIIGVGFYGVAILATVLTMFVMSGFRNLESTLPHQRTLHLTLNYAHDGAPAAENIRNLLKTHGFDVMDWSYQLSDSGKHFGYDLVLVSYGPSLTDRLVDALRDVPELNEFRLSSSRV